VDLELGPQRGSHVLLPYVVAVFRPCPENRGYDHREDDGHHFFGRFAGTCQTLAEEVGGNMHQVGALFFLDWAANAMPPDSPSVFHF